MSYSCSTIVLEKLLNDQFDPEERRITIENFDDSFSQLVIRKRSEHLAGMATPVVRRKDTELSLITSPDYRAIFYRLEESGTTLSFLVKVTSGVSYDRGLMIRLVNRYRTAGKTWGIYNIDLPDSEIFPVRQFNPTE